MRSTTRLLVALIPPIAAAIVLLALWSFFRPALWFLFFPAVFLSSWIGGLRGAVAAAAIALVAAFWVLPPMHSFRIPVGGYVEGAIFFGTAVAYGVFHERVRGATERAQRFAQERAVFAALVENSSDFIGIFDANGKPVYVNPAGRRMVGLDPDRRVDDTELTAYYADDQRAFASDVIVKEMIAKGHWEGETSFRNWQTQAAIPVSDAHFLIRDPETRAVIGMGAVTRDITERKRAEDALRRAEARSSGILSVAADAIICVDEQQRITLFNEAAERIFGYSKTEAIGAQLGMLIPKRFRAAHAVDVERYATDDAYARGIGHRHREVVGLRKSGEEFPADTSLSKLGVEGERILTVALRDITDHKRFEDQQALLAEMGRTLARTLELPEILSSTAQLVIGTLADACVIYLAGDHGELYPAEAAIRDPSKAPLRDALAKLAIDRLAARERIAEVTTNRAILIEHVSHGEHLVALAQRNDDEQALHKLDARSMIIAPLCARGRIVGAIALISTAPGRTPGPGDVRFVDQVAQRVALAIENARLFAEARHAIQVRDDVIGIVAHDLRNPLGSIMLQAGLLRPVPDERSQKTAESIERSASRMSRLIDDLLDVTRIEEGGLSVEQVRVATAPAITYIVDAQEAAGSELRTDVAPDVPDVWADRDRLLQILDNLVGNAVKFTEPGGRITVGAAPRGDEVLFWVADSGPGIAPDDLPHVFDRFWQAQKGRRSGAGLGMAIAKGLVEAHGGTIWVHSTLGRGTTVFFTMPQAPRAEQHLAQPRG